MAFGKLCCHNIIDNTLGLVFQKVETQVIMNGIAWLKVLIF